MRNSTSIKRLAPKSAKNMCRSLENSIIAVIYRTERRSVVLVKQLESEWMLETAFGAMLTCCET